MQDLERTAKHIGDLDGLIRALLASVPSTRPGQRELRACLGAADAALQVLRMAIAMERPLDELAQASKLVHDDLHRAQLHFAYARHDRPTHQAVQLAYRLAQRILACFTAAKVT